MSGERRRQEFADYWIDLAKQWQYLACLTSLKEERDYRMFRSGKCLEKAEKLMGLKWYRIDIILALLLDL